MDIKPQSSCLGTNPIMVYSYDFLFNYRTGNQASDSMTNTSCSSPSPRDTYTVGWPHVRGDNPRALASELSYLQVDRHCITILYHLHQCRSCTSRDVSC